MSSHPPDTGWHIDQRCTNCDVARQLAPGLIGEVDGRSAVIRQPRTDAEERAMRAAAYACHTRSIRHDSQGLNPTLDPFPLALDEHLYLCGHNSPKTAGANSYLLCRPTGNLMIDTPRWSSVSAAKYEALGPVTEVLLTHRDHAAHGRRYADRFGARLWIHEGDLDAAPDADEIIHGTEPIEIADKVVAHPLPGHTKGSVLYLADNTYCFSGDSLYWSRTTRDIEVFDSITWYSITELAAALERTAPRLHFEWLLPGHGDRRRLAHEDMKQRLQNLAARTRKLPPAPINFSALRW
ncbi:MBL fold metallo-hydrolase [Nonomuraea sp. NPDC048901]|uniref:MBL fold metallo-hydrolase n=1 Tax=Nonomuraea sp. NPDC048901 TaxID=3155627 RepID=UPI0034078D8A